MLSAMDIILSLLKKYALPDLRPGYIREFHEEVRNAIADGKLTEKEIAELEQKKEELGLSDESLSTIKQELYIVAFTAATEDEHISDDEWDELEHIQEYLDVSDAEIARSKKELYRMRILSEIKKGGLPVIRGDGIVTDEHETVHWKEDIDVMSGDATPGTTSIDFSKAHKEDSGTLYITSKRVIVKGARETAAIWLKQVVGADCLLNGVLLHVNGRKSLTLRYRSKGNHNVTGSILLAALTAVR